MLRPRFAEKLEDFPLDLPAGKSLATVLALTYAPDGSLYILHQANPPEGEDLDTAADGYLPQIVHVTADGKFIDAWGGPDHVAPVDGVPQWPAGAEGLDCDADGNLWLFGYFAEDNAALKFSPSGELLLRIGQRGKTGGDADTVNLGGPTSCYHDTGTREVFIADGYVNHRVISFNSDTGEFIRMWGAYGKDPTTLSAEEGFGNPVHKVIRTPEGTLLVCDRIKNRIQEFELVPGGVRYLRETTVAPGTGLYGATFDLGFCPDGNFLLDADGSNGRVWILERPSLKVLGWVSVEPEHEGDDNLPRMSGLLHRFVIEPSGDILMARTSKGIKRMRYLGLA